jgi:hypothetical protein
MRRLKELIVDLPSPCGLRRTGGNGSPLVACRFDGEAILKPDKFVAVE